MVGAYRVLGRVLRFEPKFSLQPGVSYRAVFYPANLPGRSPITSGPVTAILQKQVTGPSHATSVLKIYPTAEVVPENLLKFYVYFSAPMSRGRIYDHITLRDEFGKTIDLPFLEIDEELWDPEMKRVTLFIDPGRIKRGVTPLEEVGPALEEGKGYTLVLGRGLRDGKGNPLKEEFEKRFTVGPADRTPLDPALWRIDPPRSETSDALRVEFREPLDHALALRMFHVTSASGQIVDGHAALFDNERHWSFAPTRRWSRGTYHLVVQTTIEDLAGNNIGKAFDVDLFDGIQKTLKSETIRVLFEVR